MQVAGIGIALGMALAGFAGAPTDFGIRTAPGSEPLDAGERQHARVSVISPGADDLGAAVQLGGNWGIVTSARRTPEHNRRVGGVPNSYHLTGRAVDIARRQGVRHSQIDAAFRQQGFELMESLDEGDHSHIAFRRRPATNVPATEDPPADEGGAAPRPHPGWSLVIAPGGN